MSVSGIALTAVRHTQFVYQQRLSEIFSKVRSLERRIGLLKKVRLSIYQFCKSPGVNPEKNIVKLPPWFLFKYSDIPYHFRITDENDPRLFDQNFLNEFASWMNDKIREANLSSICRPVDLGILQIVIRLLRDPTFYEKCRDFSLAHELSHIAHYQKEKRIKLEDESKKSIFEGGMVIGFFLLFLSIVILPFIHLTIAISIGGIAFAITGCFFYALLNQSNHLHPLSSIESEKQADLDAAHILRDAEGGIYYLKTHIIHNLMIRRNFPNGERMIDFLGNNIFDRVHPKISDRIDYLQRFQFV